MTKVKCYVSVQVTYLLDTNIKENHKSEIQQKLKTKIKDETDTNEQTSTV